MILPLFKFCSVGTPKCAYLGDWLLGSRDADAVVMALDDIAATPIRRYVGGDATGECRYREKASRARQHHPLQGIQGCASLPAKACRPMGDSRLRAGYGMETTAGGV
jgi:hypothetical protein